MQKNNILQLHSYGKFSVKTLIMLVLAAFINAVGVGLLLVPSQLIDGGISGLSYLLNYLTDINISIFIILLNVPFYVAAYRIIGVNSVLYSLFSIFMYAFAMYLLRDIFKLHELLVFTEITGGIHESKHFILAAIFGGLLSGVGSGLTIKNGSSFDGIEILAVMLTKRIGFSVGQIVMFFNVLLFSFAGIFMGSFLIPLYSVIAYVVGIKAVDSIIEGLDKAVSAIIITVKGNEIATDISKIYKRGITILEGKGYYSDAKKDVLFCVVNRFEVGSLKKHVFDIDPQAFITFSEVSDVVGTPVKFRRKTKQDIIRF
jgi:uncharacterized membrane-anchored protein YitT (DUF2179 family)